MSLPENLVRAILVKLPVKSAVRLKCVCKSWRDRITDPDFGHDNPFIIFHKSGPDEYQILNPHNSQTSGRVTIFDHELMVIGSCNGIICFREERYFRMKLYNPITREYRVISHPRARDRVHRLNPEYCYMYQLYAFGFDSTTNDYKVVYVNKRDKTAEVYNLRTSSWSKVQDEVPASIYHYDIKDHLLLTGWSKVVFMAYVYVNGCCYWVSYEGSLAKKIIAFSFRAEKFRVIEVPRMENTGSVDLGVLNNSVAVCFSSTRAHMTDVWGMSKCGSKVSWIKKFSIISACLGSNLGAFWGHGTNIFQLRVNGKVVALHTEEGKGEHRNASRTRLFRFDCPDARSVVFKPSLVSLQSGCILT